MTEVWLTFLVGLAGSPHCLGMCGGIVAAVAITLRDGTPRSQWLFQLLYNLGRITTYALLGMLAGLLGSSLSLLTLKAVAGWVFAAANLMVLLLGLASALRMGPFTFSTLESDAGHLLAKPLRWAIGGSSLLRAFPLGLVLGFLPCGLVYTPLLAAAASGSPLKGSAMMAALGIGTMPLLLSFGAISTTLSSRIRGRLSRLVGVLLALVGGVGLWRVMGKMGYLPQFPFW